MTSRRCIPSAFKKLNASPRIRCPFYCFSSLESFLFSTNQAFFIFVCRGPHSSQETKIWKTNAVLFGKGLTHDLNRTASRGSHLVHFKAQRNQRRLFPVAGWAMWAAHTGTSEWAIGSQQLYWALQGMRNMLFKLLS